ncbi:hypothetical protein TR74_06940, partial [Carbonactinospora thermoautotrophica]
MHERKGRAEPAAEQQELVPFPYRVSPQLVELLIRVVTRIQEVTGGRIAERQIVEGVLESGLRA